MEQEFADPVVAGQLGDEEGPQFNNLVVDKNTGRVYIGGVNKLYQLSPNLELMVRVCAMGYEKLHNKKVIDKNCY